MSESQARAVGAIMRTLHAVECKVVAEEAVIAWLDTVAPESRNGALEAWVKCIRWRLEEGG